MLLPSKLDINSKKFTWWTIYGFSCMYRPIYNIKLLHTTYYLHTTMSLSHHKTMPIAISLTFEVIRLGNGNFVAPFLINVTTIVTCISAIGFPWNDMPNTPTTSPKAHANRLKGFIISTFIFGFIVCKNGTWGTHYKFDDVHHVQWGTHLPIEWTFNSSI